MDQLTRVPHNPLALRSERFVSLGWVTAVRVSLAVAPFYMVAMAFELTDKPVDAKVILVDENNKFVSFLAEREDQKI